MESSDGGVGVQGRLSVARGTGPYRVRVGGEVLQRHRSILINEPASVPLNGHHDVERRLRRPKPGAAGGARPPPRRRRKTVTHAASRRLVGPKRSDSRPRIDQQQAVGCPLVMRRAFAGTAGCLPRALDVVSTSSTATAPSRDGLCLHRGPERRGVAHTHDADAGRRERFSVTSSSAPKSLTTRREMREIGRSERRASRFVAPTAAAPSGTGAALAPRLVAAPPCDVRCRTSRSRDPRVGDAQAPSWIARRRAGAARRLKTLSTILRSGWTRARRIVARHAADGCSGWPSKARPKEQQFSLSG